ncbi:MAG: 6-carboxytetrahydropterin synthase [Acidobacteriia bacterium]|nr:6-carboxytetrahydropterin synthase [Terriglobia bacterium]
MMRLTRRYRFSASHRLHSPVLTEEANQQLYGKCNNPYGHGHDYVLEVTARGPVDQETGLLMRAEVLDTLVERGVLSHFRQSNLNDAAAFQGNCVPTTENLVREIERRLKAGWPAAFAGPWPVLDRVRIQETKRNVFQTTVKQQ